MNIDEVENLHQKLGHASLGKIEKYLSESINVKIKERFSCSGCNLSKITKSPFTQQATTASKVFERIHVYLMGSITPMSNGHHQFSLTLVNNFSSYISVFPLRAKSKAAELITFLIKNKHHKRGYYPNEFCCDGGG